MQLRARFAADAADSGRQVVACGQAVGLAAAFGSLEARLDGRKARRPRARRWHGSTSRGARSPTVSACSSSSPSTTRFAREDD